ncbi:MAG: hypothetical protein AABX70_01215 [Nanoarchaeota archaeon]
METFDAVKDELSQIALTLAVEHGMVYKRGSDVPVTYEERLDCVQRITVPHELVGLIRKFGYSPSSHVDALASVVEIPGYRDDVPFTVLKAEGILAKLADLRESRGKEVVSLLLEQLIKIPALEHVQRIASPEGEKHVLYPAGIYRGHLDYYRRLPESSVRRQEFTLQKAQELLGRKD